MRHWSLECGACGAGGQADGLATVCQECGKPLLVRYPLDDFPTPGLEARWSERQSAGIGMWRFRELLPLAEGEEPITLGEGNTPLIPLPSIGEELGLQIFAKDEGRNPTGSFKDRGLSAAVTRAVRDEAPSLVVPSAGNAAAALSAYAARAGIAARIYIPRDTPPGVERRCRSYGAELVKVDGLIDECGRRAADHAAATGAFNVSTLREPYRIEGKKTMMLEIVEELGGRAPDAIVYPTGGGTGLIASWKVLGELAALGIATRHTRLYSVQSTGCAPIVKAFSEGRLSARPWENAKTLAWGLRVPGAIGDFLILEALRESGGGAVAVPDEEMSKAAAELGRREGVGAAIEGGATLAATRVLHRDGAFAEGDCVVLFNTGNLLTY